MHTEIIKASEINGRESDRRKVKFFFTDDEKTRCLCHFTQKEFARENGIILGAVIPQAPYSFWCAPDANEARKQSVKLFNDTVDMNCNTCAKLQRLPFDKKMATISGLQPGRCDSMPSNHPYHRVDHFLFAPEDCMSMACHVPR